LPITGNETLATAEGIQSVEIERAFIAADALCTKLRSRLADDAIDAMCFM